ncbi:MAG: A24 family peptidase [Candidatus Micrarchaeota archaeon]
MQLPALGAFLAFSAAASFTDLKSREIPDWLNYGFLLVGAGLALYLNGPGALLGLFAVVLAWFCFAYAVYRLGAWAGGDVKFFSAMAPYAFVFGGDWLSFLPVFMASAVLLVPLLVLIHFRDVWRLKGEILGVAVKGLFPAFSGGISSYVFLSVVGFAGVVFSGNFWLMALLVVAFLLFRPPVLASAVLFALSVAFLRFDAALLLWLFALSFAFSLLPGLFKLFSAKVLRYDAKIADLGEGDVPAETILLKDGKIVRWNPLDLKAMVGLLKAGGGKGSSGVFGLLAMARRGFAPGGRVLADSLSAGGLSAAEIKELKRAGVKWLRVKRVIPFAPVLAAGFLAYFWALAWLSAG